MKCFDWRFAPLCSVGMVICARGGSSVYNDSRSFPVLLVVSRISALNIHHVYKLLRHAWLANIPILGSKIGIENPTSAYIHPAMCIYICIYKQICTSIPYKYMYIYILHIHTNVVYNHIYITHIYKYYIYK